MKEKKYILVFVILAIVIFLNLPVPSSVRLKAGARDSIVPFQNVMSLFLNHLKETALVLGKAKSVVKEKEEMVRELAELREKARRLERLDKENEELRKHLNFSKRSNHKLVLCEIITRGDVSGWWKTIRLNKGTDDGLMRDMAVITTEGLIGKTIDVSRHTSDVLLVTDPNCRVSCTFSRTGAFGIISGPQRDSRKQKTELEMLSPVKPCTMNYVSKNNDIWVDDEVVTSGLGGVYPEGFLVGRVVKSTIDSSGLYKRADIVPAADLLSLKYVFVVVE